jgi:hypothetical protein
MGKFWCVGSNSGETIRHFFLEGSDSSLSPVAALALETTAFDMAPLMKWFVPEILLPPTSATRMIESMLASLTKSGKEESAQREDKSFADVNDRFISEKKKKTEFAHQVFQLLLICGPQLLSCKILS